MFRLFLLLFLGLGITGYAVAADYEINLSVLDALEVEPEEELQLPVPAVKTAKPAPVAKASKVAKSAAKNKAVPAVKKMQYPAHPEEERKNVKRLLPIEARPIISKEEALARVAAQKAERKDEQESVAPIETPVSKSPISDTGVQAPVADTDKADEKDVVPATSVEDVAVEGFIKPAEKIVVSEVVAAEELKTASVTEEDKPSDKVSAEEKKDNPSAIKGNSVLLLFDEDTAELTSEIVQNLTDLSEQIGPQNPNKITIEAYNYDNGANSFSRKRLSLSRAVAVRSWLLAKGHKSFGIKIINTEDTSLQNNILVSF